MRLRSARRQEEERGESFGELIESKIGASKIEIRQVDGEKGIFTEILIDGHKLHGVRSYKLEQGVGDCIPTLTIDLNAFDFSTDVKMVKMNQAGYTGIESITFKAEEGEDETKEERTWHLK